MVALAIALPFGLSAFRVFQFTQVLIYAIALLGLNMLTGFNGQISLGHGAFYAIGAYTTAIMIDRWNIGYALDHPRRGDPLPRRRVPVRPARPPAGGPLPGAGDLRTRPLRPADPEVLRALDGRLPGHRALQAQAALRPPAQRGPVALLLHPGHHHRPVRPRLEPPARPRGAGDRGDPRQPHRRRGHGRGQRALQVRRSSASARPIRASPARCPPSPWHSWPPTRTMSSCRSRS